MSRDVRGVGSARAKIPEVVDVAIVGGGIMGLCTAYHLARTSRLRVAVIERDYLVAGASGRNGGGVRMQWGDAGNVRLMMESIDICRDLAQELDINLWFRQGGYLFLARTDRDVARLERNAELHRSVGAPTRLISAGEARDIVPQLDVSGVRMASFNPEDGVVFPWAFCWGYAARAVALGATIRTHTRVEHIEPLTAGYRLVLSTGEHIEADTVVNATGAWSPVLNRKVGVSLPNHPHRHEILSTEPLKPFLDPLVVDLESGLYFSQSTRGEIVTGVTMATADADEVTLGSSLRFLRHVARALTRVMPVTANLDVLRQWSGPYDLSPDGDAIVGPSPGQRRWIQMCGFTGHGFMMAPAVGRIVANWIARGDPHPMLDRWDPARFADGTSRVREDMIIG
jgi:sarcosine oxidase subunit beta